MTRLPNEASVLDKALDWRMVARLLQYVKPYKWQAAAAILFTLLNAPLDTAQAILTKTAIDVYLAPEPSRPLGGFDLLVKHYAGMMGFGSSVRGGIIFIGATYFLVNVAQLVILYVHFIMIERVAQNVLRDMRQQIFVHFQKIPLRFYDRNPVGHLVTRLSTDVEALNEIFRSGILALFSHVAVMVYIFIWMFRVDWALALVCFVTLLGIMAFVAWFKAETRLLFRSFRIRIAAVNSFLLEHIAGMSVVQLFTRETEDLKKFQQVNQDWWHFSIKAMSRNAMFYSLVHVLASAGIGLVIWYGGGRVMHNAISLGTLIAFIQLSQAFYNPISEMSAKYNTFQAALTSCESIFKLLDEPAEVTPHVMPVPFAAPKGRIEFRNVWFAYRDDEWVLKDISFVVKPGERLALVGHTGAGKTSIINVLLRFYEIQRGQILIDNIDIKEIPLDLLRSSISLVPQDIFLFTGDIISNIRLGEDSITIDRVKNTARELHLDKFIKNFKNGYDSEFLEQGAGLSVGQRQLIGLARALAFDRPILVLDEATSSIDTETEVLIRGAVSRLLKHRTSLVIAHRLSTIRSVDQIIVLQKGEIRETGDHSSLMARKGIYWKLFQLQFGNDLQSQSVEIGASD
jgi:ATP-binding cassette subfamily B protein